MANPFKVIDVETSASWYTQSYWCTDGADYSQGVVIRIDNTDENEAHHLGSITLQFVAGNTNSKYIKTSTGSLISASGRGTTLGLFLDDIQVSNTVTIPNMPKSNVFSTSGSGTSTDPYINTATWFCPRYKSSSPAGPQDLDEDWTYEGTKYTFTLSTPIVIPAKSSVTLRVQSTESVENAAFILQMGVVQGDEAEVASATVWRYNKSESKWEKVLTPKRYDAANKQWVEIPVHIL